MAGSKEGGRKAAETMKRKYGSDFYLKTGSLGGSAPHGKPRGFAALSPERRAEISRKGGAIGGKAPKRKKHDN